METGNETRKGGGGRNSSHLSSISSYYNITLSTFFPTSIMLDYALPTAPTGGAAGVSDPKKNSKKAGSRQIRVYDPDGFRRRADCFCFRDRSRAEVCVCVCVCVCVSMCLY